jgi:hypothetical protein
LNVKNITVKQTPSGKYFAVLLVENSPKNASKNILKEGLNLLNRRAYGDSLCKLGTSITEHCSLTSSIEKECE